MTGDKKERWSITKSGKRVRYLTSEELEQRLEAKEYPEAAQYFERLANRQPVKEA